MTTRRNDQAKRPLQTVVWRAGARSATLQGVAELSDDMLDRVVGGYPPNPCAPIGNHVAGSYPPDPV
jgi:hypothetical protein